MPVSVIIPTCNGVKDLNRCLGSSSFARALEYEVRSLVIVDNRETELAYRMFNISDEQT